MFHIIWNSQSLVVISHLTLFVIGVLIKVLFVIIWKASFHSPLFRPVSPSEHHTNRKLREFIVPLGAQDIKIKPRAVAAITAKRTPSINLKRLVRWFPHSGFRMYNHVELSDIMQPVSVRQPQLKGGRVLDTHLSCVALALKLNHDMHPTIAGEKEAALIPNSVN